MKDNKTYLIITLILFIGILIPTLVQDGMFLDGVTYSAISKNLANGYGSFWEPNYTKILYPSFHEHPPMVLIIQSYFFVFLGNAFYTERVFCLLVALLTIIGIIKCWRLIADSPETRAYYWLPIFLWLSVPIVSWSYKNNLLENTMGVFTIFAVYFILKALFESKIIFLAYGSILIILAFLSKGFVGIFPVAVPLIFAIVYNSKRKAFLYFMILVLLLTSISFLLVKIFPEIRNNISNYFNQQLIPALSNKREITTNNRYKIILDLVLDMSIPLIIIIYVAFIKWRENRDNNLFENKKFLLFILIALSASIPLIISLKQRKFYLIPSIPFYVLSFGFLVMETVKDKLNRIPKGSFKWINRLSYIVLTTIIIFSFFRFGKFSRDEDKLNDIYTISKYIPEGTIISTSKELWTDWTLVAYLSRIGYLSLDCTNEHEYFLIEKDLKNTVPKIYNPVNLKLTKYIILKRSTETNTRNCQ